MELSLTEDDFWDMTIAELIRAIEAAKERIARERKDKAFFDYRLANLIGVSVSRIYNKQNQMPSIEEAYSELFDVQEVEEREQERKTQRSIINFKKFAQSHNARFKNEV
ncbi:MAG: hypothetical protein KBT27_02175 [Prevotellaceae bacterium]|nr:hypothetical protein [Candidatus Faecinaster equi]